MSKKNKKHHIQELKKYELTDDEFYEFFNPIVNINEKVMNENCKAAVELVKNRMEKDNISIILIRTS